MSDFAAKMHQNRFRRLAPDPAEGAYRAPQTPIAGSKRAYF